MTRVMHECEFQQTYEAETTDKNLRTKVLPVRASKLPPKNQGPQKIGIINGISFIISVFILL